MSVSILTLGYGSFAGSQFIPTLGYSQSGTAVRRIDTHDGFDRKHKRKEEGERLHNQIEQAFREATGGKVLVYTPTPIVDDPLERLTFKPYPRPEENDDDEWLLLI